MAKKITQQEFLERFYRSFPEAKIEILDYSAISRPIKIKCLKCGNIIVQEKASDLLKYYFCCIDSKTKLERLYEIYSRSNEYELIKKIDKDNVIVHCKKCGNDIKRDIPSCLASPFACRFCNTIKINNMISKEEVQERLNEKFFNTIQILTYNGQLEKSTYKCLKCGLIFQQKQICLVQSRGCPKCDRWKSKGESFIANYLSERKINYKEQVAVPELPLQHFDFGIYNENNEILCYIEVQGEQHYINTTRFKTPLEKVQERDNRKRKYCKENNIKLYELIYKKGKFLNLDILPF